MNNILLIVVFVSKFITGTRDMMNIAEKTKKSVSFAIAINVFQFAHADSDVLTVVSSVPANSISPRSRTTHQRYLP